MLAGLTETIRGAIGDTGYPALALLIAVENVLPPLPSEVILPLAGFRVSEGTLSYLPAVMAATVGSVAGALLLYALGRFGGRPLILRHHRLLRVSEDQLDRADRWFDRHADLVVLFGRMVPGARSVVSIPAGMAEMPLARFTLLTAIGSGVWNAALIGAGWGLGDRWDEVTHAVGQASEVVLIAAGAAIVVLVVIALWRRRRGRAAAER